MTDLEKFKAFFSEMGVKFEHNFDMTRAERIEAGHDDLDIDTLSVANHFTFKNGKFIGVEADAIDYFAPRIEKSK